MENHGPDIEPRQLRGWLNYIEKRGGFIEVIPVIPLEPYSDPEIKLNHPGDIKVYEQADYYWD